MFNKFNRIIHNKYLKVFKFLFFLRYLFVIFFISSSLFLFIPNFFDYEKKSKTIKNYIQNNYNLKITDYEKIEYRALPSPSIEFVNAKVIFKENLTSLKVENIKVYPKIFSIYNLKNFQTRKVIFKNNNIVLKTSTLKFFVSHFFKIKNKLLLDNLTIEIKDENQSIIRIKKLKYINYGYRKNIITGILFGKKFKFTIDNDLKNINFKFKNSGISAEINFDTDLNKSINSGKFKSKILSTNLKFNFFYDGKNFKIKNYYHRNKDFSFKNNSVIILNPYLEIKSNFLLEDFDVNLLEKINFNDFLKHQKILKKINMKSEINFLSKKFSNDLIDKFNLNFNLAYGRMNYEKKISISENVFYCKGDLNFLEEFPLIFFDCDIETKDKQKLLKIFSVKSKAKNENLNLNVKGKYSILNKKINFKKISMNEKYEASEEDLKYFKEIFENILIKDNLIKNFSLKKIKEFILEIS